MEYLIAQYQNRKKYYLNPVYVSAPRVRIYLWSSIPTTLYVNLKDAIEHAKIQANLRTNTPIGVYDENDVLMYASTLDKEF